MGNIGCFFVVVVVLIVVVGMLVIHLVVGAEIAAYVAPVKEGLAFVISILNK